MARPKKGVTFWDRVLENTEILENGCHLFVGYRDECGYGRIFKDGRAVRVHREVWKLHNPNQEITGVIMHSCDTPNCINPAHLSHGTQADNIFDMVSKGRRVTVKGEKQHDAKLNDDAVKKIRFLYENGIAGPTLAKYFDVSDVVIQLAATGKTWSHINEIDRDLELLENLRNMQLEKKQIDLSDIPEIRAKIKQGMSCSDIAKLYNVSSKTIRNIKAGITWKHA